MGGYAGWAVKGNPNLLSCAALRRTATFIPKPLAFGHPQIAAFYHCASAPMRQGEALNRHTEWRLLILKIEAKI
jgi:hypothetical protein